MWTKYTGDYDKKHYDVLTDSDQVYLQIWPQNGKWLTRDTQCPIKGIIAIRESLIHPVQARFHEEVTTKITYEALITGFANISKEAQRGVLLKQLELQKLDSIRKARNARKRKRKERQSK